MRWSGRAPSLPARKLAGGTKEEEHAVSQKFNAVIAVIGIDIGKNSFHVVGLDERGAIVLRRNGLAARCKLGLPTYHRA